MPDIFQQVFEFNELVVGVKTDRLALLSEAQAEWLVKAYNEEIVELGDAHSELDFVGAVDATIDLIYFAAGALRKMGLTAEQAAQCFSAVHEANMTKKRGAVAKRGGEEDATKPDGWVGPEERIAKILGIKP